MGKLFLVGTPIGNLEDITIRALKTLEKADLILSEDKRVTLKLINHFNLGKKELYTFNEVNSKRNLPEVLTLIRNYNSIVLVSDAGMPVLSDPGYNLVNACWEEGIEMEVIPGPSAITTVLAISGFPASKFLFLGFLPRDKKLRRLLKEIKDFKYPVVFFESPHRINKTLNEILESFGDIELFVGREMTKVYQEFFKGRVSEGITFFESKNQVKGELTVVISP